MSNESTAISLEIPKINYGTPLENFNDVNKLRSMVGYLFQRLDNIDTLSDACKNNDKCFRNQALKEANSRHNLIQTDGHRLFVNITKLEHSYEQLNVVLINAVEEIIGYRKEIIKMYNFNNEGVGRISNFLYHITSLEKLLISVELDIRKIIHNHRNINLNNIETTICNIKSVCAILKTAVSEFKNIHSKYKDETSLYDHVTDINKFTNIAAEKLLTNIATIGSYIRTCLVFLINNRK
jgi:hypothetical protein